VAAIASETFEPEGGNATDDDEISDWVTEEKDCDLIGCLANSMHVATCINNDVNTLDKRFFAKVKANINGDWITLKALIDTGGKVNLIKAKWTENLEQRQRDIYQVGRSKVGDTNVLRHKMDIQFLRDENSISRHKFYTTARMTHDVIFGKPFLEIHHPIFNWTSGKVFFKRMNTEALDLGKDEILEHSKVDGN
jgi:hypothetical protein